MIFLINLPLGIWAMVTGKKVLPDNAPTHRTARLDVLGVVLAGAGMFLLVYPLVQGRELGWPAWTFVMLAASLPVLAGFVVYQLRRKQSGRTPLVELSMFAKRSYSSPVLISL